MASETMGISMLVSILADFRVVKTSQIVELLPHIWPIAVLSLPGSCLIQYYVICRQIINFHAYKYMKKPISLFLYTNSG